MQSSCFCNNFFLSFTETHVSFNNFKDLLNLNYKKKCEVELRNFFFSEIPMATAWYMTILVVSEIPWNRAGTSILQKPKQRHQYFNWILHHIRNNWLSAIFFSPGDGHTKGFLILLHLGLEGVTEVDTGPKKRFVFFKVTPFIDRVLYVYAPSGHSTREQLSRWRFFEGLQSYMENKNEGNENKIILGDFNCIMDKMERDGRNKTIYKCHFSNALSNSSWIMDWRIYGEGRTQIPLSSPATIDLLAQDLQ